MTDNTAEAIRRAERAQAMITDPLFAEAWAEIAAELEEQWRTSPARDADGRERIWIMRRLLDKLRMVFVGHVEDGKIARANLAALEKARHLQRAM